MIPELEAAAVWFLRWKRRCRIVLMDRESITLPITRPDIIGVTMSRLVFEVEVKRTIADMRHNEHKWAVQHREERISDWPFKFYFMVPPELVEKAKPILPSYAGLLTIHSYYRVGKVVVEAPQNKASQRLSPKHVGKLMIRLGDHANSIVCRFAHANFQEDYSI